MARCRSAARSWAGAKKAIEMAADYFLQLENFRLHRCLRTN